MPFNSDYNVLRLNLSTEEMLAKTIQQEQWKKIGKFFNNKIEVVAERIMSLQTA